MPTFEITSSQARRNFYKILEGVGERGDNYTIRIYKNAKVRVIREELAQILEEVIGKEVWDEIHKILDKNRRAGPSTDKAGEGTKETIRKLLKSKFREN
ncbi:hypothetical protein KJ596_00435 [Patescibacteria group bacterium]|nr:hypothetical protein [Patescibacteria group bacterium]MBU1868535.1 hypothetical protein [Patescibacteria group bacterium]